MLRSKAKDGHSEVPVLDSAAGSNITIYFLYNKQGPCLYLLQLAAAVHGSLCEAEDGVVNGLGVVRGVVQGWLKDLLHQQAATCGQSISHTP